MGKKIKLSFLSFYSGEVYRGVETYVYELANRLADSDVDVTVYQNGPKLDNTKYKTMSVNLKVDWKRKGSNVPFLGYWPRLIGRFTRKVLDNLDKDVDIVVTTNGGLEVFFVKLWCFIHRKKIIAVGQSGPGADDKWNLLCMPDVFVGISDYAAKWANKFNPFVKVIYIPNGVDLKKFNQRVKPIRVVLPHPIILSVGALESGKRLDLLIKAVSKTNASLLLVGKGRLEEEYQKIGDELLKDKFKILSLPFNDMPKVYTTCDVFSYPTVPWESFGIVMVEAMASGLPVVATDDPIRREIVGGAGLFVDPMDTDKYAETLEKALAMKWGGKPRKQAEKFSWDDIARQYCKLIDSL